MRSNDGEERSRRYEQDSYQAACDDFGAKHKSQNRTLAIAFLIVVAVIIALAVLIPAK
jgi:hypothetical protein